MENETDLLRIADNTVPLTYTPLNRSSVPTATFPISAALFRRSRRMIDYPAESPIVPAFWGDWYFAMSEVPDTPQPGDTLTGPDGEIWYIQRAIPSERNGTWRCLTYRYHVRFGPDDKMDLLEIQIPAENEGEGADPSYTVFEEDVPCKFSSLVTTYSTSTSSSIPADRSAEEKGYILTQNSLDTGRLAAIRRTDGVIYTVQSCKESTMNGGWHELEIRRSIS